MIRLYDPEDLLALQILKKKKRNSLSAASESQENKRTDAKKKKTRQKWDTPGDICRIVHWRSIARDF